MGLSRLASAVIVLLLAVSTGLGQSLTEAAKKEKERRAAYKNKPTAILTNEGLSRLNKKEAMSASSTQVTAPEAETPSEPAEAEPGQPQASTTSRTIVPRESTVSPTPVVSPNLDSSSGGNAGNLESRWQKAKEYADLLELKLNALWQEFYNTTDMTFQAKLQQEIGLTFEKYTQAREDEARALAELEKQKKD